MARRKKEEVPDLFGDYDLTDHKNKALGYLDIPTKDWFPSHKEFEYSEKFVKWIDSINSGWQNKTTYEPFEIYKRQAEEWGRDETRITDFIEQDDQMEWLFEEISRCRENSLYSLNKYGYIKEDRSHGGMLKYKAWKAQEVLLFLFDCKYSLMIGKARQIGFTTTMCLAGMMRVNLNRSYFIKFITHSENKGIEIFRDKVKWAFAKLPDHISMEVKNWTKTIMSFDRSGKKKGKDDGGGSRFQVDSPKIDAINGGSPSCVFIDEIGLFEIFGEMMREGRPALFKFDPLTQKMTMQQQFMAWGTSGDMDRGGAVFESEFKMCLQQWKDKNYEYGIIPLFMNAYARRGVDDTHINNEKNAYLALQGTKKGDSAKVQFHQHYPITIDDMFIRKSNTLVPVSYCNIQINKIYDLENPPVYGFFEPIFDITQPLENQIVPYRIVGARFIPSSGRDDESTTCMVISHPPEGQVWVDRWYQGTDPVNSETGHSKMSSTIWDSYDNTVASVIFHRERKFKETYLQCLLQSLYYDQEKRGGVSELIENNIGDMYLDFQEQLGFKHKFIANASLPPYLQTNGKWFGISNKVNTAPRIIAKIEELIELYGDNLHVIWLWEQLKTFVEKQLKSSTSFRQSRYQAGDLRYDFDDVIFSVAFAYINAQINNNRIPENISITAESTMTRRMYVQNKDTNYRKKLADVDRSGKVVRYL